MQRSPPFSVLISCEHESFVKYLAQEGEASILCGATNYEWSQIWSGMNYGLSMEQIYKMHDFSQLRILWKESRLIHWSFTSSFKTLINPKVYQYIPKFSYYLTKISPNLDINKKCHKIDTTSIKQAKRRPKRTKYPSKLSTSQTNHFLLKRNSRMLSDHP